MGTEEGNKNLSGLPMYHLRRIGPSGSKNRVANVMDFYRVTYMIGRSEVQVDFYIDSSNHMQSASISRCHARVVRQHGNQHKLYDDSLNGVFVNNIKIAGSCVLREGDRVTFGHPCGARLPPGSKARQPDSHHQFMFEACCCIQVNQTQNDATGERKNTVGFKKPVSPAETSSSNSTTPKKIARKTTQCFSTDDVRQLKQAWEEKQNSSASDTSDAEDSAQQAGTIDARVTDGETKEREKDKLSNQSVVNEKADERSTSESHEELGKKEKKLKGKTNDGNRENEINNKTDNLVDMVTFNAECDRSKETAVTEDKTAGSNCEREDDVANNTSAAQNDFTALEGTVNSIIKDLCKLRETVDNSVENSEHQIPVFIQSPTKDACIQTSECDNTNEENIKPVEVSPTKEMGIQTSQVFCESTNSHLRKTSDIEALSGNSNDTVEDHLLSNENDNSRKLSEMEHDGDCETGFQTGILYKINKSKETFETNKRSSNTENVTEISESCMNKETAVDLKGSAVDDNVNETFFSCTESADENCENQETSCLDSNEDSDREKSHLKEKNSCIDGIINKSSDTIVDSFLNSENDDETLLEMEQESHCESGFQTRNFDGMNKSREIHETNEASTNRENVTENSESCMNIETADDQDSPDDDNNVNETFYSCIETDGQDCEKQVTSTIDSNEDSDVEECSEKEETSEDNECVLVESEMTKCAEYQEKVGDVCKEGMVETSAGVLSNSIEYGDEENESSGLQLSNSIEYSGDESDENFSDSEKYESDGEESQGSIIDEQDKSNGHLDTEETNLKHNSVTLNSKSDSDHETCEEQEDIDLDDTIKQVDDTECITIESLQGKSFEKSSDKTDEVILPEKCESDISNINKGKRKISKESASDTVCDSPRKRHCSETMNILNGDAEGVNLPKNDLAENSNHSEVGDENLSSSQKGLQKLKIGMKKFFKFWTKKTYNMNEYEGSDGGYIYLEDKAGGYKLLELDCPNKVADQSESKYIEETAGDERIHEESHCERLNVEANCCETNDVDTDNFNLYTKKVFFENEVTDGFDINKDETMDREMAGDIHLDMETTEAEKRTASEETDMSCGEEMAEGTENTFADTKAVSEDSIMEESFDTGNDLQNLEKDIVESSMCQTDNEIDPSDMIKGSILASAFRTPSKHLCEQSSPVASPVSKTQSKHVSQLQSPVIAKQRFTNCSLASKVLADNVRTNVTKLFEKETSEDESSQLSCRFSDDGESDFISPEIDFSNLDDGSDFDVDTEDDLEQDDLRKFENITHTNKSKDENVYEITNVQDSEIHIREDTFGEGSNPDNLDRKCDDNDSTSDPLESYINHGTEDDGDNDSIVNESNEEATIMDDIDFDFCDSESEKENNELPDSNMNGESYLDLDEMEEDSESEEEQALKRKYESGSEHGFQKKQKSPSHSEEIVDTSTPQKVSNSTSTPFKTPTSKPKSKLSSRIPVSCQPSPGQCSSTQLMDSPSTQDLDTLTMTQVNKVTEQLQVKASDSSKSQTSRSKAKDLMEKLKARRRVKEEAMDDFPSSSPTPGTSQSAEVEIYNRTGNRERSQAQMVLEDVKKHVDSCWDVINKMKSTFNNCKSLQGNPRVATWRRELLDLEKRFESPKTVIAVVGDTGSGKSSLMNAILDHRSVLPTSGIRACTAVVVEVVNNPNNSNFQADIEFLQRQEWMEELQVLLKDLTGLDGTVKNRPPDPTSDAYVSYCKVKAVYGRIDRFEVLARLTTVTHWLGRVKVIKSTKPGDFRRQVEKYIETQEPGAGGQYWPIVKHVRLRMPKCDVCSSGASLVDLPGVRDSNAARDKIAKEYMKNCTAVWVVSSIHRAIDDKTAKDLLGENFRRQLLMDGQYGSIAFICTKTDVLMPSEIIRPLELEDQTKEHEDKITEMESEKSDLELTVSNGTKEMRKLSKTVASLKTEAKELRDNLAELGNLIDLTDLESSQSEEKEAIEEYEKELKEKVKEINDAENRMDELHDQKHEATQKSLELEKQLNVHRKAIASICARARNEYSKSQIKRDFKAGLKEMKRRAGMLNDNDDDEEDDIYSDEDDDDVGSSAENLKVFCCSSTEYQKMKNLLTDDGPPQVFSCVEDTQIPALRHYVHEMTSVRRKQWLERLIRNVGRFVFDLQMYISEGGDMKSRDRSFAKSAIDKELQKLDTALAPVIQKLSSDIDSVFDGSIRQKMEEGASNAASEANSTCAKWGAPVNRDPTKDKKSGGLHWATYRAAVRRQGVFTSGSYGPIDFNEDLAEPMYRSMTIVWDRAFSGMLWRILDKLKQEILLKLKMFLADLAPRLEELGIQQVNTERVSTLLLSSASYKLTEMVAYLKDIITNKQRDISRIITPLVQSNLLLEYSTAAVESGTGMYMRIKTCMSNGIDKRRMTMFDEASQQLLNYLIELQTEVVEYVRQTCHSLIQDLRTAFEPLWEAPSNTSVIRSAFMQPITEACLKMHAIYDEAGLSHTEERTLVPAGPSTSATSCSAATVSPSGSGNTLTDKRDNNGWQTYENTFQRKQDTDYGTVQQCGQVGVRVKTEKLSQSRVSETMEIVSRVNTIHVKQEKACEEIKPSTVDQSALNFGCQTLQDLQCGKLEISPVEVTVQTTPGSLLATSRPNVVVISSEGQQNSIRYNDLGKIKVLPGNLRQTSVGNIKYLSQPTSLGHPSNTPNSLPQYGIMPITPDGHNVILPYHMKSLVTGKNFTLPNTKGEATTSYTLSARTPSTITSVRQSHENTLVQMQKPQSESCGASSFHQSTSVSNSQRKPVNTPTFNMVVGKENVSSGEGARTFNGNMCASQSCVSSAGQGKNIKQHVGRSNLSSSQKNASTVPTAPVIEIKTEPVHKGVYGRVKDLGTIDLTDE